MIHDDGNGWSPLVELVHPIRQRAQRRDDEMGSEVVFLFTEQCDQSNGLDSFA